MVSSSRSRTLRLVDLLPAECEQLLSYPCRTVGGLEDLVEIGGRLMIGMERAEYEFTEAQHHGHLIVHLVSHAAGERADRLEPLGLAKLPLPPPFCGHIPEYGHPRDDLTMDIADGGGLDRDLDAMPLGVLDPHDFVFDRFPTQDGPREWPLLGFDRPSVPVVPTPVRAIGLDALGETALSVNLPDPRVDEEQPSGGCFRDRNSERRLFEHGEQPKALGVAVRGCRAGFLPGAHQLGNIGGDEGDTLGCAVCAEHGLEDDIETEVLRGIPWSIETHDQLGAMVGASTREYSVERLED